MMDFKSQIATTREQSEQLLALGLKPETADCFLLQINDGDWDNYETQAFASYMDREKMLTMESIFPSWSLSRLLELMPGMIYENGMKDYQLNIYGNFLSYSYFVNERHMGDLVFINHLGNIFDGVISIISWLISKEYFNKDYLK